MVINKFSDEQIDSMYSDEEFMIFVNHYFSSFDTCIQKANVSLNYGIFGEKDFEIYLRIVLANLSELRKGICELEKNLSFTYSEMQKNIIGNIQGRLQVNNYVRDKYAIKVPKEYPCVIKTMTSVTPENLYLIFIVDYVLNLLCELKQFLISKRGSNLRNGLYAELKELDAYTKEFKAFTRKGYFFECRDEFQRIKRKYNKIFPIDQYNLIVNRFRKGKIRNSKAYIKVFEWYDALRKGSILFINGSTLRMLRYSDDFANKLFELWCLYSIKKTFIYDFKSELLEENDIMDSSKSYIFKIQVVTGGILEIYFQKGNELYWRNQSELIWKYKKEGKEQGLIGIPDISIKYKALRESLIMIDIKNRIREAGQNAEEIYKMIGYFTNFEKAFNEQYGSDVKRQAALIFRNDKNGFEENLESEAGYLLKILSVSPGKNEKLNEEQFKVLCKYILNMQGFDGTTSELLGGYFRVAKSIVDEVIVNQESMDDVAYKISEQNHNNIRIMFQTGDLAEALPESIESLKTNYFPHIWNYMDEEAKKILGMAECLYNSVTPCDTADYAPFCLEYCRALEVQMNALIFQPFKDSYDTNSLTRTNRYYEKLNAGRPLTLGECLFSLDKCNHPKFPMRELKSFVIRNIKNSDVFFDKSVDAMRLINEQVRRKAAHTEVMSYEELVETRQKIIGIGFPNLFYTMLDKR